MNKKKKLLFCIGINEIIENEKGFISIISNKMDILSAASNEIQITAKLFPEDIEQWDSINPYLTECILEQIGEYVNLELSDNELVDFHDAYYGSPSPYVYEFLKAEKPVMIWNPQMPVEAKEAKS